MRAEVLAVRAAAAVLERFIIRASVADQGRMLGLLQGFCGGALLQFLLFRTRFAFLIDYFQCVEV